MFKDKGSKHFGYAFAVFSEIDIKERLEEIKAKHPNASHHCYAYKLGADGKKTRANDDGEPANTAGKPILGQLDSYDVTNTLIVVVRYFGGTKLGKGGLINAYKTASSLALESASIIEKQILDYFKITFNYEQMSGVMRIITQENFNIEDKKFDISCELLVSSPTGLGNNKLVHLNALPNVNYTIIKTE